MKALLAIIYVARVLAALIAGWQIVGLLPVLNRLTELSQLTRGMWFVVLFKVLILVICLLGFFGLKRFAAKLRDRTRAQDALA